MALPPKGDPTRPAHLAARSTRLLGILLSLLGVLAVLATAGEIRYILRGSSRMRWYAIVPVAISFGMLGFGIGLLVIVRPVRRMRVWAVITGMVMTSCLLAVSLLYLVLTVWMLSWYAPGDIPPRALIPVATELFALVAFGQMLMQLIQAFKHRKNDPNFMRGFAPLMVQPIGPLVVSPVLPPSHDGV